MDQTYSYDGTDSQFNTSTLNTAYSLTGLQGSDTLVSQVVGSASIVTDASDKTTATGGSPRTITINLSGASSGNYTLAKAESGQLIIDPASLTFTADNQSFVYGDAFNTSGFTYQLTAGGLISGDTLTDVVGGDGVTYAISGVAQGDDVGTYNNAISINSGTVDGTKAGNYIINLTAGDLNITPRAISNISGLLANDKIYDATNLATINSSSAIYNGIIGGDNLNIATATATFDNKNVGTNKLVSVTGLTLGGSDAGNYILADNTSNATADVTARPIIIQANGNQGKVYGDAEPINFSYSLINGALQGSDVFSGNLSRDSGDNVGSYAINQNTLGAGSNYIINYLGNNFDITKAPLIIDVQDAQRQIGQPEPIFTYLITGFKRGDTQSVINGLNATTSANGNSPVGNYSITANGASALNYSFSYQDGILSILPSPDIETNNPPTPSVIKLPNTVLKYSQRPEEYNNITKSPAKKKQESRHSLSAIQYDVNIKKDSQEPVAATELTLEELIQQIVDDRTETSGITDMPPSVLYTVAPELLRKLGYKNKYAANLR